VEKIKILYAEDQTDLARLVKFKLEKEGYSVFYFNSGEKILEAVPDIMPDLFVLDIMMPIVDGITVLKGIKANPLFSKIPVILLTSLSNEDSIVEGLKVGADDYILKPFSTSEFLARIKKVLNN
jgi:DNA-binding response OmpR family regulator